MQVSRLRWLAIALVQPPLGGSLVLQNGRYWAFPPLPRCPMTTGVPLRMAPKKAQNSPRSTNTLPPRSVLPGLEVGFSRLADPLVSAAAPARHPAVDDCAVIGIPQDDDEAPKAFVVLKPQQKPSAALQEEARPVPLGVFVSNSTVNAIVRNYMK